jgi:hypothetical protein
VNSMTLKSFGAKNWLTPVHKSRLDLKDKSECSSRSSQ